MDEDIDVKSVRESLGLTQAQLAERLGLDRSSVSRMESGQAPKGPTKVLLRRLIEERTGEQPSEQTRSEDAA